MRSCYNPDKFFQKMKKKKELQTVIDNIDKYSIEDINNLSGSHFPAWIREQLLNLKIRGGKTSEDEAHRIASLMIAASENKLI